MRKIFYLFLILLLGDRVHSMNLTPQEELQALAYKGTLNADELARLEKAGADANKPDDLGDTPLLKACAAGMADVVDLLIRHGINPETPNEKTGITPLLFAIQEGKSNVVKVLLEKGADVNKLGKNAYNYTPLIEAIYNKNKKIAKEIVKMLLDKDADVNLTDQFGHTALDVATSHNQEDIISLLQEAAKKKADRKAKEETDANKKGLFDAINAGILDKVKVCIAAGAAVDEVDKDRQTPLYRAILALNAKFGQNEIEKAKDIVKILIEKGANVTIANQEGETPLALTQRLGNKKFNDALKKALKEIEGLLENALPKEQKAQIQARRATEELFMSIISSDLTEKKLDDLLSKQADINAFEGGDTPLIKVVRKACNCPDNEKEKEIIRLLLKNGADVSKANLFGKKPLDIAIELYKTDIQDLLVKAGGKSDEPLKENLRKLKASLQKLKTSLESLQKKLNQLKKAIG